MFAIHSNHTIIDNTVRNATLVIKNGFIAEIIEGTPVIEFDYIDVGDKVLMAGVIDTHVHINEPGRTAWEGFDTATRAAISGGITMLVEMPLNASPVTTTVDAFNQKIASSAGKLHTNCGFWGGVIPGNEKEIVALIEKGVLGFKAFLIDSGIDDFPCVTEQDLRKVLPVISRYGLPLLVHCEINDKVNRYSTTLNNSYLSYLHSRPREWEDHAIELMISLCEEFDCKTHIVHLSSSNSIKKIQAAKHRGLPLTVETAQHYLYFNAEDIRDGQTQFKCAPPIREKENNDKLWQALKEGVIDFVATDHSPAPPDMKHNLNGDFTKAWGGIASVQFSLPSLWTAARNRNCSLADLCKWLTAAPAVLAGKQASKGRIKKGFDADLVVWDHLRTFEVTNDIIRHRHTLTPYLGEQLTGVVEQTYIGGVKVFDCGISELNKGQVVFNEHVKSNIKV